MQPLNTEQMIITDARHMPIVKAYAKKIGLVDTIRPLNYVANRPQPEFCVGKDRRCRSAFFLQSWGRLPLRTVCIFWVVALMDLDG
jgi:hypothetical protein